MNIFDRLLGIILPDDKTQPKSPVFATPLVVETRGVPRWYRVSRQCSDGSLLGIGPWYLDSSEAEEDLQRLLAQGDE